MFGWFNKEESLVQEEKAIEFDDGLQPPLVVFDIEDNFVEVSVDEQDGELLGQFLFKLEHGLVLEDVVAAIERLDPITREEAMDTYHQLNSSKQGLEQVFQDKLDNVRSKPCVRPTQVFINPQEMLLNELDKDF